MDFFVILVILYFIYFGISFVIAKGRLISPSVVFSISFFIVLFLALVFRGKLGFEVCKQTFILVSVSGFLFLLMETLVSYMPKITIYNNSKIESNKDSCKPIYISNSVLNGVILFLVISLVIAFYVMNINSVGGSFSAKMKSYKDALLYSSTVRNLFLVNQLYKITMAITYVIAYVMVYDTLLFKIKIVKQWKMIVVILLYMTYTFVPNAARQPTIELVVYILVLIYIMSMKNNNIMVNFSLVKKAIPILGIIFLAFYYSMELVGRRKSQRTLMEYMAVYICGGLYSLNHHIGEPARTELWGQSSFADIYRILIKLGIIDKSKDLSYLAFDLYGNQETMFGRWYSDFGNIGVYIMTVIVSLAFSVIFYNCIVKRKLCRQSHLCRIYYAKLIISLVWAGYGDRIRPLFSLTTIIVYVLIALVCKYITGENKIKIILKK